MSPTEKLIKLVQQHPCLYNSADKEFKNSYTKDLIWKQIAAEMDQTSESMKMKWKNLKDGYTKHRKQTLGMTNSKSYSNWIWSSHLQFLDDVVKIPKATTSREVPIEETIIAIENIKNSPPSSPASNISLVEEYVPRLSDRPLSPQSPDPLCSRKRKCNDQDEEAVDKVLDYLRCKKRTDATDLLFASYAQTFRKLTLRTQASVKLQLAKIFADAELKDFESTTEEQDF